MRIKTSACLIINSSPEHDESESQSNALSHHRLAHHPHPHFSDEWSYVIVAVVVNANRDKYRKGANRSVRIPED